MGNIARNSEICRSRLNVLGTPTARANYIKVVKWTDFKYKMYHVILNSVSIHSANLACLTVC